MTHPQTETKIELVTEAIEALVISTVAHQLNPAGANTNYDNVRTARKEVHDALANLLQPTLRVVHSNEDVRQVGGLKRTITKTDVREIVPYGGEGIDGMNLA